MFRSSLVLVVTLFTASLQQQCDQSLVNSVVDFVLEQAMFKYPTRFPLPDVSTSLFRDRGTLELQAGSLAGLPSAKRVGDLHLHFTPHNMLIQIQLHFQQLIVFYQQFKIGAFGIESAGDFEARINDNLVKVEASMKNHSICFFSVNKVIVKRLGHVDVDLKSGCRPCSLLASWVSTKLLNKLKERVRSLVQAQLDLALQQVLDPRQQSMICKTKYL